MSTPEGKGKEKVKKVFQKRGIYYHMPVQNGMGKPTLDFIACANGKFVAVETKAPGKKPTARQEVTMAEMRVAGAFVFVVSCDAEVEELDAFMAILATSN